MSSNETHIINVPNAILSVLNNATLKNCFEKYDISRCYLSVYGHNFVYFILAFLLLTFSLVPQIVNLFQYNTRFIAGISYQWIIIRILALTALILSHTLGWSGLMELIALSLTIIIFIQILMYSNSLHRANKIILIIIAISIWIIGRTLIFLFAKHGYTVMNIGYLLFAIQMLPQILLNSLLRTAKALSEFSLLLSAMSDLLLFYTFSISHAPLIHLISIYYSFSFLLYIILQKLVYSDAHIHLISRSTHTILTPGVDIFTGLDKNGAKSNGQEPQMFSLDDLESLDGSDILYQAVTTTKPTKVTNERTPLQKLVFYIRLGLIFFIEILITIMLVYRVRSPWIIIVPTSIFIIIGIFFLLRTRFNNSQSEFLRKIL